MSAADAAARASRANGAAPCWRLSARAPPASRRSRQAAGAQDGDGGGSGAGTGGAGKGGGAGSGSGARARGGAAAAGAVRGARAPGAERAAVPEPAQGPGAGAAARREQPGSPRAAPRLRAQVLLRGQVQGHRLRDPAGRGAGGRGHRQVPREPPARAAALGAAAAHGRAALRGQPAAAAHAAAVRGARAALRQPRALLPGLQRAHRPLQGLRLRGVHEEGLGGARQVAAAGPAPGRADALRALDGRGAAHARAPALALPLRGAAASRLRRRRRAAAPLLRPARAHLLPARLRAGRAAQGLRRAGVRDAGAGGGGAAGGRRRGAGREPPPRVLLCARRARTQHAGRAHRRAGHGAESRQGAAAGAQHPADPQEPGEPGVAPAAAPAAAPRGRRRREAGDPGRCSLPAARDRAGSFHRAAPAGAAQPRPAEAGDPGGFSAELRAARCAGAAECAGRTAPPGAALGRPPGRGGTTGSFQVAAAAVPGAGGRGERAARGAHPRRPSAHPSHGRERGARPGGLAPGGASQGPQDPAEPLPEPPEPPPGQQPRRRCRQSLRRQGWSAGKRRPATPARPAAAGARPGRRRLRLRLPAGLGGADLSAHAGSPPGRLRAGPAQGGGGGGAGIRARGPGAPAASLPARIARILLHQRPPGRPQAEPPGQALVAAARGCLRREPPGRQHSHALLQDTRRPPQARPVPAAAVAGAQPRGRLRGAALAGAGRPLRRLLPEAQADLLAPPPRTPPFYGPPPGSSLGAAWVAFSPSFSPFLGCFLAVFRSGSPRTALALGLVRPLSPTPSFFFYNCYFKALKAPGFGSCRGHGTVDKAFFFNTCSALLYCFLLKGPPPNNVSLPKSLLGPGLGGGGRGALWTFPLPPC